MATYTSAIMQNMPCWFILSCFIKKKYTYQVSVKCNSNCSKLPSLKKIHIIVHAYPVIISKAYYLIFPAILGQFLVKLKWKKTNWTNLYVIYIYLIHNILFADMTISAIQINCLYLSSLSICHCPLFFHISINSGTNRIKLQTENVSCYRYLVFFIPFGDSKIKMATRGGCCWCFFNAIFNNISLIYHSSECYR